MLTFITSFAVVLTITNIHIILEKHFGSFYKAGLTRLGYQVTKLLCRSFHWPLSIDTSTGVVAPPFWRHLSVKFLAAGKPDYIIPALLPCTDSIAGC